MVHTALLDKAESLNVDCMVEIFDHLGQFPIHFLDFLWVGGPTDRSRCDHQQLPDLEQRHLLPLT
jgi:hypothetical protein